MPATADEPIDFRAIYYVLREKAHLIALCAGVGALLGTAYVLVKPTKYAAETIVQVEQAPSRVVDIQEVESKDLGSKELLKTIEQDLSSPALLDRVIRSHKLDASALGLRQRDGKSYSQNELIRTLSKSVSAKLIRGTRLISVVAVNRSPERAQEISLATVEEYKRMNTEQRLGGISEANNVLSMEAARLKKKLAESEQALQAY